MHGEVQEAESEDEDDVAEDLEDLEEELEDALEDLEEELEDEPHVSQRPAGNHAGINTNTNVQTPDQMYTLREEQNIGQLYA